MIVSKTLEYTEYYVPPRCRLPRSRKASAEFTANIAETTSADAPIAFRMTDRLILGYDHGSVHNRRLSVDYRWWKERLYVLCRLACFKCLNGTPNRLAKVSDIHFRPQYGLQKVEIQKAFVDRYSDYLLIDGRLHEKIDEPRYYIGTYGLGCNHGLGWGTSLSVDHYYNSNISKDRYYRIDQEAEANKAGWEIAQNRGDTKAKPHFTKRLYERFEIFIPEAVRCNPAKEAGDGDPFINRMNEITKVKDPTIAGLMAIASVFR